MFFLCRHKSRDGSIHHIREVVLRDSYAFQKLLENTVFSRSIRQQTSSEKSDYKLWIWNWQPAFGTKRPRVRIPPLRHVWNPWISKGFSILIVMLSSLLRAVFCWKSVVCHKGGAKCGFQEPAKPVKSRSCGFGLCHSGVTEGMKHAIYRASSGFDIFVLRMNVTVL